MLPATRCFNPCYVGLWSVSGYRLSVNAASKLGFNPCYVGLWSVRGIEVIYTVAVIAVSILVMLDYGL